MPFDPASLTAERVASEYQDFESSQLAAVIELANRQYWELQAPTLPDPLYDQLVERLRALDPEHSLLSSMGPAPREEPGADVEVLAQRTPQERFGAAVKHRHPMLSLEKCYSAQELVEWVDKRGGEVLCMPKIDGVAASLLYDAQGQLQVAATRGSGQVGDDITLRVLEISQVPQTLSPAPQRPIEVRGEVYMQRSVFDAHYAEEFSHPRNLTAGSLKRKDASGGARGDHLSFYAYDLDGLELPHERDKLKALNGFGFSSPDAEVLELSQIEASVDKHTQARPKIDYEVDGIVYRVASVEEYQELGATGHHPRGAIAYKFQGQAEPSKLEDIEWSVSRTGSITPVAIFEPVLVDGAQLTRASLHNLQRFEALKLCRDATLLITRRGGVIPMVQEALTHGDPAHPYRPPSQCPACDSAAERVKRREGEFLFCASPSSCSVTRLRELEHFAKVTDMMGFGPKFLAQAYDAKVLTKIEDYYTLRLEGLTGLERIGVKTAKNLLAEVDKTKSLPLATFLQSLGIPHLGKHNAPRLAQAFGTLQAIRAATPEQIIALPGFQDTMAEAITEGLSTRAPLIDALLESIEVQEAQASDESPETIPAEARGPLFERSVLFTGTLSRASRAVAQKCAKALGATIASGVSRSLDVLIIGQGKGAMSSKEKKARALIDKGEALELMDEAAFWALVPAQLAPPENPEDT